MTIDNYKDLKRLMQLCREMGCLEFKIDNVEFKLDGTGPTPKQVKSTNKIITGLEAIQEETRISTPHALTEEQLLNWSSAPGGIPG